MSLKFFLNKIAKCDNIESYSLTALSELKKHYDEFVKKSGADPDFPNMPVLGGDGSINIKANQLSSFIDGEDGPGDNNKTD